MDAPAVPHPVITERGVCDRGSGNRLVCTLPVHHLPAIKQKLDRLFRVSYAYNTPREYVALHLDDAEAMLVNAAAPYHAGLTVDSYRKAAKQALRELKTFFNLS